MKTLEQIQTVLALVQFPGYTFKVHSDDGYSLYLKATFEAPSSVSGVPATQHTRKWQLSQHMTTSEIVQTALKCVLTAVEHEAREHFKYRGQAIFCPHFDVEALVAIRRSNRLEVRQ